jgi:hypothetical protein
MDNDLKLELHALGTTHQLIQYLKNCAEQIERDSKKCELPWYDISNGGSFMGDFKVTERKYGS